MQALDPYAEGDASRMGFWIKGIRVQDGPLIDFPQTGVTLIVGPNNSGKSTLLRQLWRMARAQRPEPQVLTEVSVGQSGSEADFIAWLRQFGQLEDGYFRGSNGDVEARTIAKLWEMKIVANPSNGGIYDYIVNYADAHERKRRVDAIERREVASDPSLMPLHMLESRRDLEVEFSAISLEAFRQAITLDQTGRTLKLRVGTVGDSVVLPTNRDGCAELQRLPLLSEQGDGMIFLLGGLLPLVTHTYPVTIMDEPEAFLHPPQATLMGQKLGALTARGGGQLVIATHDSNVIRGLLDTPELDLKILRLTRHGDDVTVHEVAADRVRQVAIDPLLKHTAILEAYFYRLIVLCENERDCVFYRAALSHLALSAPELGVSTHDVLFFPTSGKTNMARVVSVLSDSGIPIVTSPDLDLLRNYRDVEKLVNSLDGDTKGLNQLWHRATSGLSQRPIQRTSKEILASIESILSTTPNTPPDKDQMSRIREELKTTGDKWHLVAERGTRAMTSDRQARDELLNRLGDIGIVLVQVGTLESFADVDARKDAWLDKALAAGAHKELPAQEHLRQIIAHLPKDGSMDV